MTSLMVEDVWCLLLAALARKQYESGRNDQWLASNVI